MSLIFQCLVFQDGGLTALGANILNMALAGTLGGYFIYRVLAKLLGGRKGIVAGAVAAAWFSVAAAASLCALELALSGTSPLGLVLPAMAAVHAVIGIGEGMITGLIVGFILKTRPDLIYDSGSGYRVQGIGYRPEAESRSRKRSRAWESVRHLLGLLRHWRLPCCCRPLLLPGLTVLRGWRWISDFSRGGKGRRP